MMVGKRRYLVRKAQSLLGPGCLLARCLVLERQSLVLECKLAGCLARWKRSAQVPTILGSHRMASRPQ